MEKQITFPAEASTLSEEQKMNALPRFSSSALFGQAREVVIEHAGQEYRLRLTSQSKLILTK